MANFFKTTSFFLLFLFSLHSIKAQSVLKEALQGEWIKNEISLKDGSTIYNENVINSSFGLEFIGDSLIISIDGRNSVSRYTLIDSILNYRGNHYQIERLEKPFLKLVQVLNSEDVEPIQIAMHYKPTLDLGLNPEYYLAKNGEKVYVLRPNELEPKFINDRYSALDYIFDNFNYPEFKKGGFVARFVITKDGKIEGQRIVASSNQKYDQRLINAINKTEGKWLPAKYLGERVNCEVEYNFDLGWNEKAPAVNTELDAKIEAQEYDSNGKHYFTAKNYRLSIYYFTKALEKDPYLIDSYYLRAASYIFTRKIDEACADYLQLKILDQKRGADLYDKYCGNYKPKTQE